MKEKRIKRLKKEAKEEVKERRRDGREEEMVCQKRRKRQIIGGRG
jgi:hypothetical protein